MKKFKYFLITKSIGFYINFLSYVKPKKAVQIAYVLFSNPRKGKITTKMPKTLLNVEKETFTFDNNTFQTYIWKGNSDIILLIHGWESNASRWKKLLAHIKHTQKTIIAIDAPAHGLSSGKEFNTIKYAEYIHFLAQKYNPKILIGHSIGGATITYYLKKYKNDNVEKVVLLGAPSDLKIILNNYTKLLSLNKKAKNLFEDYFSAKFNIDLNEFKCHDFSKDFTQKAIIAHDIDDEIVLVNEGRKFASSWKKATYIETSGLGHSMHDHELYQKISQFIEEN
jgi:predicted alpha/beta hydrolase family esterase